MASGTEESDNSLSLLRTILLVIGAHVIMLLADGGTLSFGIYLTDFADDLDVGLGSIGAVGSLLLSVQHTLSPVGAFIASKIGYRKAVSIGTLLISIGFSISSQVHQIWQLFISHSLLSGFGLALVYTNVISFVGLACDDKHVAVANGVTLAGTAVGWILLPLVVTLLKGLYGWRGSLLILGSVVLHATMICLIVFKTPLRTQKMENVEENLEYSKPKIVDVQVVDLKPNDGIETSPDGRKYKIKKELKEYIRLPITYPLFGFLIIAANLIFLAFASTLYHLVSSAIKRGIPEPKAAILMTVYGIGNIISRLLHGIPIKMKWIKTSNLFAIALVVAGVSTCALPYSDKFISISLATFCIGLSIGTCIPLIYLSTREIVDVKHFPKAMGLVLFTTGFAGVAGGFLTGWIYDFSGSYNTAFFIMSSVLFGGIACIILPRVWLNYKKDASKKNNKKINVYVISKLEGNSNDTRV